MTAPVLGIDFGTTNTSAAWVDGDGQLHNVPMRPGVFSFPSAVFYDSGGAVLVGQSAKDMAHSNPAATVHGWKRFLGRPFVSDFVYRHKDRVPYRLCGGPDGLCAVHVHGQVRTLQDVTSEVFSRVVELANAAAGVEFERAVLTVPAHASFRQRRATRAAAEMAGLDVVAMMNEPTAAAFCVIGEQQRQGTFLVFDLGGGTCDATLLSMWQGLVQVIGTAGDMFLGGEDFDNRLVDVFADYAKHNKGVDVAADPIVMQRLTFAAENAKIQLSTEQTARLVVRAIGATEAGFVDLDLAVKRGLLEQSCAGMMEKAAALAKGAIDNAKTAVTMEGVVFVGGMTRMPALRKRVCDVLGAGPILGVNPDLAVSAGAARAGRAEHVIMDVMPLSIGFMLAGGASLEVVPPSSVIPCSRRVALPRPATGPLSLAFFEAVNATATEREILGTARIDAAWLLQNPGPLVVEVQVDRDLAVTLRLHTDAGSVPLPLTQAR